MSQATDGDRRFKSQYNILRILLEDLERNENDTRAMFYIARTYSTVGNHSEAFRYYEMLSNKSRWDEEVYHAQVMMAEEGRRMGMPWERRHEILLKAYLFKPEQMDALHMIAEDHFNEGRFPLAYLFALRAAQIKRPPTIEGFYSASLFSRV